MAVIGLSVPFFGRYAYEGGITTYLECDVISHAIAYKVDVEVTDPTPLYADGQIAELEQGVFQTGTLTLNTADLPDYAAKWLLDLQEVNGEYHFNDDTEPLTVGFAIIEMHQIDDETKFKTVFFPKCIPNFPVDSADTKGDSIEWQTKEITFRIERADGGRHPWQITAWHDSEAEATAYLHAVMGYDGNKVGVARVGYAIVG